ncbi:MAG TPA: hypothetical protein EYP58_04920, partial [bacterium (Candidatus Stahlbacteria)]|nr:hypothetical protein [Candidatus Stahlbacteria bacterium]
MSSSKCREFIGDDSSVLGEHINKHLNERFDVILGHRRLSIIDLSEKAHQPISNENKNIWLVFNGEIYNYIELRKELIAYGHIFKSKTDSEVVVHAYEEWGVDCVKKFNGMWAFAIWDQDYQRLFLCRDRFGIKPLYYFYNCNKFVFASEIKAILRLLKEERIPNFGIISLF